MCYKYQTTPAGAQKFQLCLHGQVEGKKTAAETNKIFENEFSFGEFQSQKYF